MIHKNVLFKVIQEIIIIYLAFVTVMSRRVSFTRVHGSITENTIINLNFNDVVFMFAIVIILNIAINKLAKLNFNSIISFKEKHEIEFKYFPLVFIFVWLPYYATFYPATGLQDEVWAMQHPFGVANQPLFYSLILRGFWEFGKLFGSYTLGLGILSFLQMGILACALSYFLFWLYKKKVSVAYISLCGCLFAFLPIYPNYAITLVKDKLFAVLILFLVLFLYDFSLNPKNWIDDVKQYRSFLFVSLLILTLRSNGIFIIIPIFLIFAYILPTYKKRLLIGLLVIFIGNLLLNGFRSGPVQEALAVPIQQIARTVASNGKMTTDQRKVITAIMPIKLWYKHYHPCTSDPIKWNKSFKRSYLQNNKAAFLKVYFGMMPKNFKKYVNAYLLQVYGFWSIGTWENHQSVFTCAYNKDIVTLKDPNGKINGKFVLSDLNLLNKAMKSKIGSFMRQNSIFLGAGSCIFITFISFCLCIERKEFYKLLPLLPLVLGWGTLMLAAPIAFAFRYAFFFALTLPLVIILPYMTRGLQTDNDHNLNAD